MKRAGGPDPVLNAIEALAVHSIDGYEWECGNCQYRSYFGSEPLPQSEPDGYYDAQGNHCDHLQLLDRHLVLATIGRLLG